VERTHWIWIRGHIKEEGRGRWKEVGVRLHFGVSEKRRKAEVEGPAPCHSKCARGEKESRMTKKKPRWPNEGGLRDEGRRRKEKKPAHRELTPEAVLRSVG